MRLVTILLCIFSLSCFKNSDLKFDDKFIEGQVAGKPAQLNQKLYVALVNPGNVFNSFIQKNNIGVVKVLDEGMIIGSGYNVDYPKLSKNIERLYPNPQDTGMCFMDIEDPYLSSLHNAGINSKEFREVLKMYVDAIKFGKKMRPNVKWGHYGVPFTRWDDKDFLVKNDKIEEIYKTVDVLFPSLYLFKDDKEIPFSKNYEYLYDNLSLSLKIGKKYNKPVIPFVLHRFHSDNPRLQWAEMDDKFWKRYIQSVLSINYNGKYAQGIVWWGADTYFYSRPEGKNIKKNFVGTQAEFMSYNDPLLIKKANIILDVLTSKK
jgi:hypothetical protein